VQINARQIIRSVALLALTLVISSSVKASNVSGKVTDVIDGNTINLKSLSHTIKVRLLAVAPPEKSQPYADVARKHLADLILNKYVVVRYTGIGEKGYLVGRVLLEQVDINAQMLRDGVAWFSETDASDLAEADRQLYPACEAAARTEKRGLWQEQDPVSPWAFRKREELKPFEVVPVRNPSAGPRPGMDGLALARKPELSSFSGPPLVLNKVLGVADAATVPPEQWSSFALLAGKGSNVQVPNGGLRDASRVELGDGRVADYSSYVGRSGKTVFVVLSVRIDQEWTKRDSEESLMEVAVARLMAGLRAGFPAAGRNFSCEPTLFQKHYPNDYYRFPYTSRKYDFLDCNVSGSIYAYAGQSHKYRDIHLLAAITLDGKEDPAAKKFLKSLQIEEVKWGE